jgi:Holliday junction resolvase RusA-like endonuclease
VSFSITVYGKPEPAGSKRAFINPKTKRAIVTDANAKAKPWKQEVAGAAFEAVSGLPPYTFAVELDVEFYLRRPRAHLTSKGVLKPNAPQYHGVRPDATKLVRAVEDAMTGIVWRDDAQVVRQSVVKFYADPGEAERCEITVRRL